MSFQMKMKNVKKFVDLKKGYTIYKKDGKNYLEKGESVFELPAGCINVIDKVVYIDDDKLDVERYLQE